MPLIMKTNEPLKTVEVCLNSEERQDQNLLSDLRAMCPVIRETGYEVVIYKSGTGDPGDTARKLIRTNLPLLGIEKLTNPAL